MLPHVMNVLFCARDLVKVMSGAWHLHAGEVLGSFFLKAFRGRREEGHSLRESLLAYHIPLIIKNNLPLEMLCPRDPQETARDYNADASTQESFFIRVWTPTPE